MDFDSDIKYKKRSEMPVDFLSRSYVEQSAISVMDMILVEAQNKDNLSNLTKESLEKKWIYKFPMQDWY